MNHPHSRRFGWQAIYGVPLAAASYGLFRLSRAVMGRLARAQTRRHPEERRKWKVFSEDLLKRPGALLFIATAAPRWNPHAVVATVGPLEAGAEIAVNLARTQDLKEWYLVVYSFPDHQPVASFSSFERPEGGWARVEIPTPGSFLVSARYYELEGDVELPAVEVDGQPVVAPQQVPAGNNRFYDSLANRSNWFHRCLGYHAYAMLRWGIFPGDWVRRTYLPVGNPESVFHYGTIRAGERVALDVPPDFFEHFRVYLTIYSRASFPVLWRRLDEHTALDGSFSPVNGHFLIRINGAAASLSGLRTNDNMPGNSSFQIVRNLTPQNAGSGWTGVRLGS